MFNFYKQKLLLLILLFTILQAQEPNEYKYKQYCNARFDYCVLYPTSFGMRPPSYNDDGRKFYDNFGLELLVYGGYNVLDKTLLQEMEEEFTKITYSQQKANWYVLSGYKDDKIIYMKTYLKYGIFHHLSITYPASEKGDYNLLVKEVSKSFMPPKSEPFG